MKKKRFLMISLLYKLWNHFSYRRKIQIVILFILMIISSFAEVVSIGAILPFLGALTTPSFIFKYTFAKSILELFNISTQKQVLIFLTYVFCVAVILSGLFRIITLWAQTRLGFSIGADLSYKIYHRTLYQPYNVHISRNSSEVISGILNKTYYVINAALIPAFTILSSFLFLTMILTFLMFVDPYVTIISILGFGFIYFILMRITKKKLLVDGQKLTSQQDSVIKVLQEGLGGIRDVLIDGTQEVYCKIFKSADFKLRRAQGNINFIAGSPRFGIEALGMVLIAVIAYNLTSTNNGVVNAIPVLGSLALAAQRLLPIVQQAFASWASMQSGTTSLNDTLTLLDQRLPYFARNKFSEPIKFEKSIEFKSLCFSYSKNSNHVLKNINLEIKKGECIGFIGTTGSGKSTFLDILMGLQEPSLGKMLIDGVEIDEINCRSWQLHIAHVPQVIYLSDNTITENIAFGVPKDEIQIQNVYDAAQKAQIADVIKSWEEGFNTVVGERGVRLSGGQRQRIGIARALYKNADVIVFDEATSALDNITEKNVMDSIKMLGSELTIIIVAHRLTTLSNCDKIVELKNGKIERIGTYEEIVNNK
jgi:ABC-type multidrug transport system fused ATPase/permease subunit